MRDSFKERPASFKIESDPCAPKNGLPWTSCEKPTDVPVGTEWLCSSCLRVFQAVSVQWAQLRTAGGLT